MKNVLIISSSPRRNGNSGQLCAEFARGAREAGCSVETVALREKQIGFCRGCEACVKTGGGCVQQDDMAELIEKACRADALVFASPIYFMALSAQLKVFIDRFIAGENRIRASSGKKAYLITACAAPEDFPRDQHAAANAAFRGFLQCLRTVELGGILNASGLSEPGQAAGTKWAAQAFEMGRGI